MLRVSTALRDVSVVVLASKDASRKRGPDSGTILVLSKDSSVVLFEIVSGEHVILRLFNNGFVEIQSFAYFDGLSNSVSWPHRSSPVEGKSLFNDVTHCSAGFLQRSVIVRSVAEYDVHVIHLQSLEGVFHCFHDVFSWKEAVINALTSLENLSWDHKFFSLEAKFLESLPHLGFSAPKSINLSGVEEVNTIVKAFLNGIFCNLVVLGLIWVKPVAKREEGYSETWIA
jgi:hypothetical protein